MIAHLKLLLDIAPTPTHREGVTFSQMGVAVIGPEWLEGRIGILSPERAQLPPETRKPSFENGRHTTYK